MKKYILAILVLFGVGTAIMPVKSNAAIIIETIDGDFGNVSISVSGSTLHVTGANGQFLSIFNVAGVKVQSFKVEGNDKHYELSLRRGCYIIKVGKIVRKVSIS